MATWAGRSKGSVWGYRTFVFFIRHVGLLPAYILLFFVVFYYFFFSYKTSKPILRLYREKMNYGWLESIRLLFVNYFHLGQSLIDKAAVLSGKHTKLKFVFNGENYLEDIVKNGKGGILLSGHLGNWDVAGHFLERLHTKINIVMFDGEDRQIKQLFDGLADHKKPQIIYIKSDLSHVFEINRALESNELVCIHADRFVHGTKTLEVPFFGEKAKFPEGPFLLALKMKKPVVFVYAVKNAIFSYELSSTPIMNFSVNNGDTLDTVATAYSMLLEKMTRRYPHQWFNYYDFWRTS